MAESYKMTFENLISVIEDVVSQGGVTGFSPAGRSMLPTIRGGIDFVTVGPAGDIKKYDIVLYRRANGKIVLHRAVTVEKDFFVMCGDNQFQLEYPIVKSQIIGKLCTVRRGKKVIDLENPGYLYRLYVRLWDLRLILDKGIYYLRKLKKRLF